MKNKKINCIGQGVTENTYHCFIMEYTKENILIYETFNYNDSKGDLKASISRLQWDNIKNSVLTRINNFMQENSFRKNRITKDINYLNVLLGKEITLLFWGIEETEDINNINSALKNWHGLSDSERWYLYTMTNANLSIDHNRGWRGAIKKILIEN
jgi:hypothetical protein